MSADKSTSRRAEVITYSNDHRLREKMARRFLIEICGKRSDVSLADIRKLDNIPYIVLIRPLVIKDYKKVTMVTLSRRFGITTRQTQYLLTRQ